MSVVRSQVRAGAYFDSVVLMQLQAALAALPGVADAGVVMATAANRALLEAGGLLTEEAAAAAPDDLVLVVKAEDEKAAAAALARVDELLARRRAAAGGGEDERRPRGLEAAVRRLPAASWVSVSVPGRWAAGVAREALGLGRHVFLFSDNVSLEDEVALKREAGRRGLLVLGPDCGTAVVGGVGLGFANRARRGAVGLVAASGTGLQAVAARLHALGAGVSHALGTGGRDLSAEVAGATTLQALDLLRRDPATRGIVLVSKPPAPAVAARVLAAARATGKPVVACLLGYVPPARRTGSLVFAAGLEEAARWAVDLTREPLSEAEESPPSTRRFKGYLRGLFAGGTLAYEALLQLRLLAAPISSNISLPGVEALAAGTPGRGHAILDLGADEFTVGRPHPMIDQDLRLRRLRREAADPEVGALLLDVVLGDGAHPDPAAELAPALAEIRRRRPELRLAVVVVATEEDPQDAEAQRHRLAEAGAEIFPDAAGAVAALCGGVPEVENEGAAVDLAALDPPVVITAGLERLHDSLLAQGATALHLDWRPPAGGDERLAALLARMKGG